MSAKEECLPASRRNEVMSVILCEREEVRAVSLAQREGRREGSLRGEQDKLQHGTS